MTKRALAQVTEFTADSSPRATIASGSLALMNEIDAAQYLAMSVRTLQAWRVQGRGPKFVRVAAGRSIRYRRTDLDNFVDLDVVSSTSEADARRSVR